MTYALDSVGTITMFAFFSPAPVFWMTLLAVVLVGTASSTVFLGLALLAAARNLRLASQQAKAITRVDCATLPAVTILKPLHGAEPRLEETLESFFLQDYPAFEIIFGCRTAADPAIAVVERLRARHPQIASRVVLSGEPQWPSAKVWSLDKMIAISSSPYLVISDSDILVRPDFLRNVVPPLLDPDNGLVTCLYEGVPADGLWSRLEALGMSVEMPSGVLIADMMEGMQFALGSVMAVRRDVLEKCGGIASTAEYYSDDFVLGNRVHAAGYRVVLSHYRVAHVLFTQSIAIGYGVIGDRRALRQCWLYPLRDLLGFFVWVDSYCGGSSFYWRGELYRFTAGGRIVSVARTKAANPD